MWKFSAPEASGKRGALPVATNLCVSALHHSGTAVASGQEPRQMAGSSQWNATSASDEGKVLAQPSPKVSDELKPAKSRCSGFLSSEWKKLAWQRKNDTGYSYHIVRIIRRYAAMSEFVFLCRNIWKNAAFKCFTIRISDSNYLLLI